MFEKFFVLILHLAGQTLENRAVPVKVEISKIGLNRHLGALPPRSSGFEHIGALQFARIKAIERNTQAEVILIARVLKIMSNVPKGEDKTTIPDGQKNQCAFANLG